MKTIEAEELKIILENHQHWLRKDCDGWKKMKADLSETDLCGVDLHNVNLSDANLCNANLENANLCGSYFGYANLTNANLHNANLSYANFSKAILNKANLTGANLYDAALCWADLSEADLLGAYMNNTNLMSANLYNVKNLYYPLHCPSSGSFTGYKKALYERKDGEEGFCLITLFIPEEAKRSSSTSFKCRCNKAYVTDIHSIDPDNYGENISIAFSSFDPYFKYEQKVLIRVDDFCENRWEECASGIHFFIDEEEAKRYSI